VFNYDPSAHNLAVVNAAAYRSCSTAGSVDNLKDEAFVLISAATDTTGNVMTVAAYNVITNHLIYRKLAAELAEAFPDPSATLDFVTLEKLPYLTAVIKEALRLSYGIIGRLPRVTPEGGAEFNGHYVPEGTIVGMSSWMMHRNETIFPRPTVFDPERWVDSTAARKLDKYLVTFSKGNRQCVGMPLAYCEIYVTLGTLFRKFSDLDVEEITAEELEYDDYFAANPPDDARRLHILRKGATKVG